MVFRPLPKQGVPSAEMLSMVLLPKALGVPNKYSVIWTLTTVKSSYGREELDIMELCAAPFRLYNLR